MGFHVSWLTVLGKTPSAVRNELGLTETDEREFLPDADVSGADLPSGWYLVFFNDPAPAEIDEATLSRLSEGATVMAFVVEESSMVSLARGHADGKRAWEVVHDADKGLDHLDVTGTPPAAFAAVRDRLLDELAQNDYDADYLFDLPAELSKAITGFRHDEDIEGVEDEAFTVLERS